MRFDFGHLGTSGPVLSYVWHFQNAPSQTCAGRERGGGPLASTNPKNLRKHVDFDSFRVRSREPSGIIENTKKSIHLNYFFGGAESVGSSRIIETHMDFFTFSLFLSWIGERGKLQNQ